MVDRDELNERLQEVDGVGEQTADSIIDLLEDDDDYVLADADEDMDTEGDTADLGNIDESDLERAFDELDDGNEDRALTFFRRAR